jgi:cyclophilin family peptidyl-prolyl cis-trans isomerase
MRYALSIVLGVTVGLSAVVASSSQGSAGQKPAPPSGPVLLMDTAKGAIQIQLFPGDAPKSIEHILGLVKTNFYRGFRIHRVNRDIVQFGDPMSRDVSKQGYWGTGGSGKPIGVAEFSKKRTHQRGAVSLAHAGKAEFADSQLFILKAATPAYDGKHVIIGQVTSGMDVVDKLAVADVIKNITVK